MKVGCSIPRLLRLVVPQETDAQIGHCVTHDLWYNNGGTKRQRAVADARLLLGWLETGMDVDRAWRDITAVRLFGKAHWGPDGRYVDEDDPPKGPPPAEA